MINEQQKKALDQLSKKTIDQVAIKYARDYALLKKLTKDLEITKKHLVDHLNSKGVATHLFKHKNIKAFAEVLTITRNIFDSKRFKEEKPQLYEAYKKPSEATTLRVKLAN